MPFNRLPCNRAEPLPATLQGTLHQEHRQAGDGAQEVWALVGEGGDSCSCGKQEPCTRGTWPQPGTTLGTGLGSSAGLTGKFSLLPTAAPAGEEHPWASISSTLKGTHSLHHCDLEGLFGSHPSGQHFHRNQGVKVMSAGSDSRHSSTFYPPRDLRQVTYPLWASVSPSCRLSITLTPFPCWQD